MPSKIIPQEHKDAMVASYLSGLTAKQSAAPFGYSWMACISELKRRGITPRTNSDIHRKYAVDETFFDTIDTEEKAYWLGFLTADANIRRTAVQLHLAEKDEGHIRKFLLSIKSNHPIYKRRVKTNGKWHNVVGVSIGSIRLAQAIKRLGVSERKSLVVRPCKEVPANLMRDYWRGIIDGDGCISHRKDSGWAISLVGSKFIVDSFAEWVCSLVNSKAKPSKHRAVWTVRFCGTRIPKIISSKLYAGCGMFLDRKMKLANEVMCCDIQRENRDDLTFDILNEYYATHGTWNAVAKTLGTSRGGLYKIRQRVAA